MYAIKLQLKLNNVERTLMAQHAGFSRFVYNYGLALYKQVIDIQGGVTKKISAIRKVLTNWTKKKPELAWMNKLSSRVYQNALISLKNGLTRCFKGLGKFPKFKRKKDRDSFTVDSSNGLVTVLAGNKIKIPTVDFLQKLTTDISRKYQRIRIEDLNISGMMANSKLADAISNLGLYEFRRQLTYKQLFFGTVVELVDRWFPSSKMCSDCGHIQPMKLSDRVFHCQGCGSVKCRDFNASLNLENAPPLKVRAACSFAVQYHSC
jgi:IS605 OrfB family transposase